VNRAIPLGHCTEDYEKRFPVYDKRVLEKGANIDKETNSTSKKMEIR